jgi:hypothetical protein
MFACPAAEIKTCACAYASCLYKSTLRATHAVMDGDGLTRPEPGIRHQDDVFEHAMRQVRRVSLLGLSARS